MKITRKSLYLLTLSSTLLSCSKSVQTRPNVILIMTDDQGYGEISACGNPIIKTPAMDAMYREGIRLENFHTNPFSAPSRAALMTGRYSQRVGVWDTQAGNDFMDMEEETMGQVFQKGGYRTGIFGKWHLGDAYPYGPEFRGFDESVVHASGAIGQLPDYWNNDYYDDTYRHNGEYQKYEGYCTDIWFDEAIRFIKENKDNPFFCYISTNAPHGPYHVPDKYTNMYKDKVALGLAKDYGMITCVDDNIAKLRNQLKKMGLDKNTIVIFMTDNGASPWEKGKNWYNAGMRGAKGSVYEGGHRVPCFLYWPQGGWQGGREITELTAHIDLLPTFAEICGLPLPKKALDGVSLRSLLDGKVEQLPERTLFTDQQQGTSLPQKYRNMVAMTSKWRLVNNKELYDISADPSQIRNVADQYPEVVESLNKGYEAWWSDVSEGYKHRPIIVGSEIAKEVLLSSESWRGTKRPITPLNHSNVRQGSSDNGYHLITVDREGVYNIALSRWPKEADTPIVEAVEAGPMGEGENTVGGNPPIAGKKLNIKTARLKVGDFDSTVDVRPTDKSIDFQVNLKRGTTQLQTWFKTETDSLGAYYVYVKRK